MRLIGCRNAHAVIEWNRLAPMLTANKLLTEAGRWREIVGFAHPGVLCRADRLIVELAAQILVSLRTEQWRNSAALLIRFESVLGKLGMSPADRSKVSVFKTNGANPYAEFG